MDNFVIKGIGIACFIFWGIIGGFLVWYVHQMKGSNDQDTSQEEGEAKASPSESPHEQGTCEHQNETALNILNNQQINDQKENENEIQKKRSDPKRKNKKFQKRRKKEPKTRVSTPRTGR
jgi:hypothetical protein